ncbi:hypothetical protein [Bradyrhizobium sp. CCBAU 51627]|uniref:hypothetical protein n=1 Tax=Bradyrhizobium sp. CCBAU 51627 TaxID=1325088 RepID=UPI002304E231|nr:hypothetical protein [Bradyrhizobium sp. CCBAU 51627]
MRLYGSWSWHGRTSDPTALASAYRLIEEMAAELTIAGRTTIALKHQRTSFSRDLRNALNKQISRSQAMTTS